MFGTGDEVDVQVESAIDRPIHVVAEYASDPSNAPTWYRRIQTAEWRTQPPARVGSRITFRAAFLGRKLEYTYEIVEFTPGESMTMQTAEGPFPMTTSYTWESTGDTSTRMTLRNRGRPSGFAKFTAPVMSAAMRRAMSQDLADLRRILESS